MILISLFGIYTCKSQDIFHKADSLFNAGNYEQSGLAYEWIIYTGVHNSDLGKAIIGRIESFKNLELFDEASSYIDQVSTIGFPDSVKAELAYQSLLVNYLKGHYEEVRSRYFISAYILNKSDNRSGSELLLCLSDLKSGRWDRFYPSSEKYIQGLVPVNKIESYLTEFHNIFDTLQAPKMRNPKTASILSMIIPGSGQIYSGYPGDGMISLGLHLLAIGGAGLAFYHGLYFTGWIGGLGILQKLYFGGFRRASELAKKRNRLNFDKFIQPAENFLIDLSEEFN